MGHWTNIPSKPQHSLLHPQPFWILCQFCQCSTYLSSPLLYCMTRTDHPWACLPPRHGGHWSSRVRYFFVWWSLLTLDLKQSAAASFSHTLAQSLDTFFTPISTSSVNLWCLEVLQISSRKIQIGPKEQPGSDQKQYVLVFINTRTVCL